MAHLKSTTAFENDAESGADTSCNGDGCGSSETESTGARSNLEKNKRPEQRRNERGAGDGEEVTMRDTAKRDAATGCGKFESANATAPEPRSRSQTKKVMRLSTKMPATNLLAIRSVMF